MRAVFERVLAVGLVFGATLFVGGIMTVLVISDVCKGVYYHVRGRAGASD